ncbi:hypothetical protein [Clostridium sp. JN-9]|jgi:hypothetical protein|uniref:hypothetical protein n=1 Tax=Clostridium sp. JN-9 TaxID=2507159 RepID=UPI000FFE0854|nr:hypothetical protein [Clostridium sp. JN-9]QAT41018.1 hypothetical protein EQM05_12495 [Clostridium sp. JN-9]
MSYENISRIDQFIDRVQDIAIKNQEVSGEMQEAYKEAAIRAVSQRYLAMFQTVVEDFKSATNKLNPADKDYKRKLVELKRSATSSAQLIASKLPQTADFDIYISAVNILVSGLFEQAKGATE